MLNLSYTLCDEASSEVRYEEPQCLAGVKECHSSGSIRALQQVCVGPHKNYSRARHSNMEHVEPPKDALVAVRKIPRFLILYIFEEGMEVHDQHK